MKHIDDDHREMFARIDEVAALGCEGRPDRIASLLRQVERYVHAHFEAEEILMSATDYPARREHRRHHREFAEEFERFQRAHVVAPDGSSCAGPSVVGWATAWLREHIRHDDAAMAAWVAGRPRSSRAGSAA